MTKFETYVLKVVASHPGGETRAGSAFLVSRNRAITAGHVVDGADAIKLHHGSLPIPSTVRHVAGLSDPGHDIAVLTLDPPAPKEVPSARVESLIASDFLNRCGHPVVGLGYPAHEGAALQFSGSIASKNPVVKVGWYLPPNLEVFVIYPEVNADGHLDLFRQGTSGGPIFDAATDTVVGMIEGFQPGGFASERSTCHGVALGTLPQDAILPLEAQRREVVWRLAYTFLRLDQIPAAGGWGRTLYRWMDNLWTGDEGMTPRNASLRSKGGTDLTCYAFFTLADFLERAGSSATGLLSPITLSVYGNFKDNVAPDGGLGFEHRLRSAYRIRHTALGALVFARCSKIECVGAPELGETMGYLGKNVTHWQEDTSHPLAMVAALAQLASLPAARQFQACQTIDGQLPAMQKQLLKEVLVADPRPTGTRAQYGPVPFFHPYGGFWRMERSNLLMSLPMLRSGDLEQDLCRRCAKAIKCLLDEIAPFDSATPENSLISYHRGPDAPRDWGLSAELAVVLDDATMRQWLTEYDLISAAELQRKVRHLDDALLATVDRYLDRPDLFRFTHGSSFGRAVLRFGPKSLRLENLKDLDAAIAALIEEGTTEHGLDSLLKKHVLEPAGTAHGVSVDSLLRMLVEKLESGEFLSHRKLQAPPNSTVAFYDDEQRGKGYVARYGDAPLRQLVSRLTSEPAICMPANGRARALDVGCGPGQYAKLLQEHGFEVELFDASARMLAEAAKRLGLASPPPARDVFKLREHFPERTFALVFACALMVHVPRSLARSVLRSFHDVLLPEGVLFVNFKIGDHSLIARDGRYFEYYATEQSAADLLHAAGFEIEERTVRWNRLNSYNEACKIQWANFYCRRPK